MSIRLVKRPKRIVSMFRTRKRVLEGLRYAAKQIWQNDDASLPTSVQDYQSAIMKHEPTRPGKPRRFYPSTDAVLDHFDSMAHAWVTLGFDVQVTSKRVSARVITPEVHKKLEYIYSFRKGQKDRPADVPKVRDYAAELGVGHHILCSYAAKQGWVQTKEPNWSRPELRVLEKYAHLSPERIQIYMKSAGFHRTVTSILLMRKRRNAHKSAPYYSQTSVCKLLGVDNHKFERDWLLKFADELPFEMKGTSRRKDTRQHGDVKLFHIDTLREFFCNHPEEIDLGKVDKVWFLWLVTRGRVKMVAPSDRVSKRTEVYTPGAAREHRKLTGYGPRPKRAA